MQTASVEAAAAFSIIFQFAAGTNSMLRSRRNGISRRMFPVMVLPHRALPELLAYVRPALVPLRCVPEQSSGYEAEQMPESFRPGKLRSSSAFGQSAADVARRRASRSRLRLQCQLGPSVRQALPSYGSGNALR